MSRKLEKWPQRSQIILADPYLFFMFVNMSRRILLQLCQLARTTLWLAYLARTQTGWFACPSVFRLRCREPHFDSSSFTPWWPRLAWSFFSYLNPTYTRLYPQLFNGLLRDGQITAGVVVWHDGDCGRSVIRWGTEPEVLCEEKWHSCSRLPSVASVALESQSLLSLFHGQLTQNSTTGIPPFTFTASKYSTDQATIFQLIYCHLHWLVKAKSIALILE